MGQKWWYVGDTILDFAKNILPALDQILLVTWELLEKRWQWCGVSTSVQKHGIYADRIGCRWCVYFLALSNFTSWR